MLNVYGCLQVDATLYQYSCDYFTLALMVLYKQKFTNIFPCYAHVELELRFVKSRKLIGIYTSN